MIIFILLFVLGHFMCKSIEVVVIEGAETRTFKHSKAIFTSSKNKTKQRHFIFS